MAATSNPSAVNTRFSTCSAYDFDDYVTSRMPIPSCLTSPATAQVVVVEGAAP